MSTKAAVKHLTKQILDDMCEPAATNSDVWLVEFAPVWVARGDSRVIVQDLDYNPLWTADMETQGDLMCEFTGDLATNEHPLIMACLGAECRPRKGMSIAYHHGAKGLERARGSFTVVCMGCRRHLLQPIKAK
jgi:hypothetical protein